MIFSGCPITVTNNTHLYFVGVKYHCKVPTVTWLVNNSTATIHELESQVPSHVLYKPLLLDSRTLQDIKLTSDTKLRQ